MDHEISRIVVPEYIRRVKLSEKRAKKYYELGKKKAKAKMYADPEKFGYVHHRVGNRAAEFLTNLKTGERVLCNPMSHGTPKYCIINGQGIYNQSIQLMVRNKVMQAIKAFFAPYVNQLNPIDVPIRIYAEIHDTIRSNDTGALWDVDNRFYMYQKAFQDCLTGNKERDGTTRNKVIIKDDHTLYVTQPACPLFIPVATQQERKLVFIICEEKDSRIINNPLYIEERDKLH